MIKEAIEKLVNKQDLTFDEAKEVMNEIMSGETPDILISAYLVALRMKGETIEEISGSAKGMRDNGTKLLHDMDVIEIVGTGGDKANTFNISTTSAFVAAAAGCKVVKHGNRGVSSKSGAADVLEALGTNITVEPEKSKELLDKVGFCFLFAQKYHPAMRFVGPVRGELGLRTIFNVLGPLTNPAGASMEIIGVYEEELVEPIAKVLLNLGVKKGMVVLVRTQWTKLHLVQKQQYVKLEIVKQSLTKLILKIMEFQFARSLIWKGETELKTLRLQKTF